MDLWDTISSTVYRSLPSVIQSPSPPPKRERRDMDSLTPAESSGNSPTDGTTAVCEVCQDLSDGLHFSVYTCRACAAFFRRTVSLKLEYTCRADGRCQIEKSARNMCRSCRFAKCIAVGMQTSAVQMSRDGIGKRKDIKSGLSTSGTVLKKPMAVDPLRPSSSEGFYRDNYNPIATNLAQLHIQSAFVPVRGEPMRLLPKMHEGYNQFLSVRKATYSLVENDNLDQMFQKPEFSLKMSNFESCRKVCQMEAHLVTDIVNTYFFPFCDLPFSEKVLLFKNFFCYLSQSDRAYQSYKLFNDPNDDRMMMPDGGYIKLSDLETFYMNAKSVKVSPEEAANIFRPTMQYIINVIVGHMRRIRLTDYEFICIIGLFLWNEGTLGITDETIQVIHETQAILFADLHQHYREMGLDGPQITAKTGLLMMLMTKLTRAVVMLKENFELAELFNMFEADICCKSFKATN